MQFEQFAAAHGLIIKSIEYGKWCRCATDDKPLRKNGAFKHLGDIAFVQNHATMTEPAIWHPESKNEIKIDLSEIKRRRRIAEQIEIENQRKAAQKAAWIISQCKHEQHAYLDGKGFPDALGLVWRPKDYDNLLVIPMRAEKNLVGVQLIDKEGEKKFLFGQRCSEAEYVIDGKGIDVWCEGFATGLSIQQALNAARIRYTIHICFSAGNMIKMARAANRGFVIADNDESGAGIDAAQRIGLPYWISPEVGEDANDYWTRYGTFRFSMELKRHLTKQK